MTPTDKDLQEAATLADLIENLNTKEEAIPHIATALAAARTESAMQQISDIGQLQTALEERDAARAGEAELAEALLEYTTEDQRNFELGNLVFFKRKRLERSQSALDAYEQRRKGNK